MPQSGVDPVQGGCRHMRSRYKLQTSHKTPLPEKRFQRYECEKGHEIDNNSEEEIRKCLDQKTGCWKEQ